MRFSYGIPKTDDDFEHLCCQLLKRHWNCPQLQRYAHRGESQDGVDIHDPSQTKPIKAAQCKLHDYGKTIPPREIQDEVDKVKKHVPAIEHYAILTTGKKSKQADKKVAEINQLHKQQGLFTVEVLTWDQIEVLLDQYPDVSLPIYNTIPGQSVSLITQQLAAIRAAVEVASPPSSDFIDSELDGIKAELENHELKVANRLARRLEERHGDKLSPRQRWRLLTLQANILLGGGEIASAGNLLLQAKQHQPQEEKAQVNEALGYELTGDLPRAHALSVALRTTFPHSAAAAAVWVRTAPADTVIAELEAEAAKFADRESEVALALSICSLNRGDSDRAERYAQRLIALEPAIPQSWLLLGQALHVRGLKEVQVKRRVELFRQAESHYSHSIELAHRQERVFLETAAYINRAIVRSLLSDSDAEEDFRTARRLSPNDADVMRKCAAYLPDFGHFDRAVEEARAAMKAQPSSESSVLLAAVLWDRNKGDDRKEALDISLGIVRGSDTSRFDEALEMTLLGLTEFKRWEEAESLIESNNERLSEVARNTFRAKHLLAQCNQAGAEACARAANAGVVQETSTKDIQRLVRVLGRLNLHSLALPLLQRIAQPGRYDDVTRMLLDSANHLHNHRVILEVCKQLREAGVEDPRLLQNEVDILQQYDRPTAISVLQNYLEHQPDDRLALLRLSLLGLQSERPDLITTDFDRLPPVEDAFPETVGRGVISLLYCTNHWGGALRYAYALLRKNLTDPVAHLLYCNLFLRVEGDGQAIESPNTVQPRMAVAYQERGDSQAKWVIIEDEEEDLLPNELSPNHALAQSMLGKKPGDTFPLSVKGVQERIAEIVAIMSKYAYRYQESMNQFQVQFPDRQDLQRVQLAREGSETSEQLDFTPIFAQLDRRRAHVVQVLNIYRRQHTPIHYLAEVVGRHVFETLDSLTNNSNIGVRWCCLGNEIEREEAMQAWRDSQSVILDLTALYTVSRLNLIDLLQSWRARRFYVSQTTFDTVRNIIETEFQPGARYYTTTDERGRYIFTEVSEEAQRPFIEAYRRLGTFARDCCSVLTVPELAGIDTERRERTVEFFGRDGLESMALAARDRHVLWTDDLTLASIAREDFGSPRGAWTQVALQMAVEEGILQQTECDGYCARLIGLLYSFTWCNASIVFQAGTITNWNCEAWPLRQVIRYFRQDGIHPQMKLQLAAHSIVGMFRAVSSPFSRQAFILAILNQLGSRRLALALAQGIEQLFGLDVLSAHAAIETIQDWLRSSLFVG